MISKESSQMNFPGLELLRKYFWYYNVKRLAYTYKRMKVHGLTGQNNVDKELQTASEKAVCNKVLFSNAKSFLQKASLSNQNNRLYAKRADYFIFTKRILQKLQKPFSVMVWRVIFKKSQLPRHFYPKMGL